MHKLLNGVLLLLLAGQILAAPAPKDSIVTRKDRKRDVLFETSMGRIQVRLSDSTPLHRDNFLKLVKMGYFENILFHRVIKNFMIQAGDPDSRNAPAGKPLGNGGPDYTVPAEFKPTLFHKKGVIAAARDNNPEKASSASQFYLTQGKVFTEAGLDSVETYRLKRKIPADQRQIYSTLGGVPHLDQSYTVFGEVVSGIEVIDAIADVPTSKGADRDRPLTDVKIRKASLVKRKRS
ncbi:MAG: peptidylprolyl isomerase [Sphingomonadales bacterium]